MRAAVLAAMMMCGLAAGARADVVTLPTPIATLPGDPGEVLNLQPFDATLGTLTGAGVELSASFNLGAYRLIMDTPDQPVTSVALTPQVSAFPLQPRYFTFATQGPLPVFASTVTGQSFSFDVTGALPLSSAADPILNLSSSAIVTALAGGKLDVDTSDLDPSYLNGVARVSYTYNPAGTAVPEPASIALLGLGIAAFGLMRRRFCT